MRIDAKLKGGKGMMMVKVRFDDDDQARVSPVFGCLFRERKGPSRPRPPLDGVES